MSLRSVGAIGTHLLVWSLKRNELETSQSLGDSQSGALGNAMAFFIKDVAAGRRPALRSGINSALRQAFRGCAILLPQLDGIVPAPRAAAIFAAAFPRRGAFPASKRVPTKAAFRLKCIPLPPMNGLSKDMAAGGQ